MKKLDKKLIQVIGLGYIGLPTAAMFASNNVKVLGVDTNIDVINTINKGLIHISETKLDRIVNQQVKRGYLKASKEIQKADVHIITVPTPFKKTGYKPDLTYVFDAIDKLSTHLTKGSLIIIESTSPVGTTEKISNALKANLYSSPICFTDSRHTAAMFKIININKVMSTY